MSDGNAVITHSKCDAFKRLHSSSILYVPFDIKIAYYIKNSTYAAIRNSWIGLTSNQERSGLLLLLYLRSTGLKKD